MTHMKRLTCEMCGSTELLKQEGVFVCQTCGTKYSVEEAKKMMVEGTVEVSGTVKVDQSHLTENFLDMARSAIASGNHSEAEQYCNKVIEIDPNNYKAFLYKGTATAWQSTFANLRILETINCWKKAFANCDKESRTEFLSYTDAEFRKIVIAMVNLAGSFVENGITDYKGNSYREHLLSVLNCVELYSKSINSTFRGDRLCSEAAISVVPCLMKCSQAEERLYHKIKPSGGESYSDFIKEYLGCIDLLNMTATFGQKSAAKALCYEKAAEVMQTINDLPFYIWSNGRYEPHRNPRNSFGSEVSKYRSKAAEERSKIEAEKKEEYWQDHPDEYKAYLKKQEEEKRKKEEAERIKRERAIKEENEKKKAKDDFWTSHNQDLQHLNAELKDLEQKKNTLKEKRYCEQVLDLINSRITSIQELINSDRRGRGDFSEAELSLVNGRENFSLRYNELLSDANAKETRFTKKRNLILLTSGLILIAFIAFMIILNSVILPQQAYNNAIQTMDNERYEDAFWQFSEIKDFKDSEEYMYKCAKALMENNNKVLAYSLFNEIKNYNDSASLMQQMLQGNPLLALSVANVGDTFVFGTYEQDNNLSNGKEELVWIVLSREGNRVLLITEKIIDGKPFNEKGNSGSFYNSTLNSWLQSEFLNTAFNANEKSKISGDILIASKSQKSTYNIPVDAEPTAYAKNNGEPYKVWYPDYRTFWTWWLSESTTTTGEGRVAHSNYITDSDEKMGVRPMIWLNID